MHSPIQQLHQWLNKWSLQQCFSSEITKTAATEIKFKNSFTFKNEKGCSPISKRALFCLKGARLRPRVLLITVVLRKRVWHSGEMLLTMENRKTWRHIGASASSSIITPHGPALGSKLPEPNTKYSCKFHKLQSLFHREHGPCPLERRTGLHGWENA